jgi:mRNA interferase MazF
MPNTTIYRFGDVILVPFPFTDQSSNKKRPAVIISSDDYNQCRSDLVLIAVTSQINNPLQFGEMIICDWSLAGLLKPSSIKPVITTLEKRLVIKNLGQLQSDDAYDLQKILPKIIGAV